MYCVLCTASGVQSSQIVCTVSTSTVMTLQASAVAGFSFHGGLTLLMTLLAEQKQPLGAGSCGLSNLRGTV